MRTLSDEEFSAADYANVAVCDWKEGGSVMLEEIDRQLSEFGLEVVMQEESGDAYVWAVAKKEEQK